MLDFLETWFRDLIWIRFGLHENILLNRDHPFSMGKIKYLRQSGKHFNQNQIFEIYIKIIESRAAINKNANKALTIESLFLHIYRAAT